MSRRGEWQASRLKYVADCNAESLPDDTDPETSFTYVDIGNVTQGEMNFESAPLKFIEAPSRARRLAKPGDTIVSTVRTYLRAVAVVPDVQDDLVFSTGFAVLHPRPMVDGRFLGYYLQGDEFVDRVVANSTGVSYPAITATELMRLQVRIPNLAEQQAIVDFLDRETVKIDSLVSEQEGLVVTFRERRSAVIDRAVLPIETADSWTRSALKYMLRAVDQGVSPQAEAGLAEESGSWGVLKSGCVNEGIFRPQEHKRLPSDFRVDPRWMVSVGDLIVSRASGSPRLVGSAAMVGQLGYQLILSDKLFRLRPAEHVDARFLYWALNSRWYRAQVEGSISGAEGLANNLPLSALRAFEMYYPPFEKQQEIALYLDSQTQKIDALIAEAEGVVAVAKERRAALITAAVTGRIDVREEVA